MKIADIYIVDAPRLAHFIRRRKIYLATYLTKLNLYIICRQSETKVKAHEITKKKKSYVGGNSPIAKKCPKSSFNL